MVAVALQPAPVTLTNTAAATISGQAAISHRLVTMSIAGRLSCLGTILFCIEDWTVGAAGGINPIMVLPDNSGGESTRAVTFPLNILRLFTLYR